MVLNYLPIMPRRIWRGRRSTLADDLRARASVSPNNAKHVVIVMDGLEDFTMEPLKWALENITAAGCVVTLLGLMPWLNIPLSSKTWGDIWMLEIQELAKAKEKNHDWKNDAKYVKLQAVIDLCNEHGVVVQKEVVMGYPQKLVVIERIISLHAAWVVFDSDKYHKKYREFYAEKIPCNMVMMNEEGDGDMIRGWPMIESIGNTPAESPASLVPTPEVYISERLKQILEENEQD